MKKNVSSGTVPASSDVRHKNPIVAFFKGLFLALGFLILLLCLVCTFCAIHKTKELRYFPHDYSVFVRTDSLWGTLHPLLDLRAADIVLSSPDFSDVRGAFMLMRSSALRKSLTVRALLSRRASFAVYNGEQEEADFIATLDMSFLSIVTRPLLLLHNHLNIQNLSYNDTFGIFEYNTGTRTIYLKPVRNLVLASSNISLFLNALSADYSEYSADQLAVLKKKSGNSLHIILNAFKASEQWAANNDFMKRLSEYVSKDSLASVFLDITDSFVTLSADVPFDSLEEKNQDLGSVFASPRVSPTLISRLYGNTQYYTLVHAGTLQELKDAFLPILTSKKESDDLWAKANNFSKALLRMPVEDLLFSWSGTEFAVIGIEHLNVPVFAIQVRDEEKRKEIFSKLNSSLVIVDNASLLIDGMRVPRLMLPDFLQNLTALFGVNVPQPYYIIEDGYIFFSESAESLSSLHKSRGRFEKLPANSSWLSVAKDIPQNAALSLYYNLNRSVPFFLRSDANIAKALELYALGKADFFTAKDSLTFRLHAVAGELKDSAEIPGFPLALEGKNDGVLMQETSSSKTTALYWIENQKTIVSLEVPSLKTSRFQGQDSFTAVPLVAKHKKSDGTLWAVSAHGEVYLFDRNLNVLAGFPVITGEEPCANPSALPGAVVVPCDGGKLIFVSETAALSTVSLPLAGSIKASPSVYTAPDGTEWISVYDKSFVGGIYTLRNRLTDYDSRNSIANFVPVDGIAFGSPALYGSGFSDAGLYFVTQNGLLYNADSGAVTTANFDGTYYANAIFDGGFVYLLSANGTLTRHSVKNSEQDLAVQLPGVTCTEPFITAHNGNIYVCPDENLVYGFDKNLELLYGFPLSGRGTVCFADVNGDKKEDLFVLSLDNKLNAWRVE